MHWPFLLLICIGIPAWITWTFVRGRRVLREWAKSNQFDLLEFHSPALFMPWRIWLRTSRTQQVYQIKVFDPATRRIRTGWVKFDSLFGFPQSDLADVTWDAP
ncbi:MAG TPA: hypothetical protein VF264_00060 [Rhodanobacteraceae bacterium]